MPEVDGKIVTCGVCGHFACVCGIRAEHVEACRYRAAAACPVAIFECDHGHDVCPICDPCTCPTTEAVNADPA